MDEQVVLSCLAGYDTLKRKSAHTSLGPASSAREGEDGHGAYSMLHVNSPGTHA